MQPPETAGIQWRHLMVATVERLHAAGLPSPDVDARLLIAHALGVARFEPFAPPHLSAAESEAFLVRLEALVQRRCEREPLQLITGEVGFRYLTLRVERGVFIPRPETEMVAQAAIDELVHVAAVRNLGPVIAVDLCSGSGAIAVSMAHECPDASVYAVELNPLGAALTQANAELAGCSVSVSMGDAAAVSLWPELEARCDVVVSNPPYIPAGAVPREPEVLQYDPHEALFGGGDDGLDVPRRIMAQARRLLRPGGLFVMEHADVQGETSRAALAEVGGFEPGETRQDLTGRDRFLVARALAVRNP